MLSEAFRVLKPGGRFAVSDIVTRGLVSEDLARDMNLWIGCVAGALEETEYRKKLEAAGFKDIRIEPTRIYEAEDARELARTKDVSESALESLGGKFMSAFVQAVKP